VLTAAHCLFGQNLRELSVLIGTTELHASSSTNKYSISSFSHPGFTYNGFTGYNDLALVFLDRCVPSMSAFPKLDIGTEERVCRAVEGMGFGRNEQIPPSMYVPDGKLRSVNLNQYVHSQSVCKSAFVNHLIRTEFNDSPINPTMMTLIETSVSGTVGCYGGDLEAIRSGYPCDGDSGGPVVVKGSQVILGVTSFSAEVCGTTPNYYTRLSEYSAWIQAELTKRKVRKCAHDPPSFERVFSDPITGTPTRSLGNDHFEHVLDLTEAIDILSNITTTRCKTQFDQLNEYLKSPIPTTRDVRDHCSALARCIDESASVGMAVKMANTFLYGFPSGASESTSLTFAQRQSITRLLFCTSEYDSFYRSFEHNSQINEGYMSVAPASTECAAVTI
jgi:secreted trypsin-like serine protease